jgi:phosphonate transport system ATP-binding protein
MLMRATSDGLRLRECRKRFGAVVAIDGVSLMVPKGQFLGVIGRSGAGKSTLLRLVNRLTEPDDGHLEFDGIDIRALSPRALADWRAACAIVFQQFNLIDRLDVITNVLIGRLRWRGLLPSMVKSFPAEDQAAAILVLERVGVAELAFRRADTLSGGQQQRVAIARALVQQPRLLLADEPVASLDPHNAALVMDLLQTINREDGLTVIVNLHDVELARRYCDRLVGMAAGRIVFDGAPRELTPAAVARIYGGAPPPTREREANASLVASS